jgi:hypothetical protein
VVLRGKHNVFRFFSFLFQSLDKEDMLSLLFYSGSSISNIFVHLS